MAASQRKPFKEKGAMTGHGAWWRASNSTRQGEKNPQPTEKKVVERLSHGSEEIIHERPMVADNPRASHVVWAAQEHRMVAGNTRTFHGSEQSKTEGMTRTIALVAKKTGKKKSKKKLNHTFWETDESKLGQVVGGNWMPKANLFEKEKRMNSRGK